MKTKTMYFFKALLLSLTIISCSKTEDICYSCDKELNKWAYENIEEIQNMNRTDLLQLDYEKRKTAFRAMSQSKKQQIWLNKIEALRNTYKSKEEQLLFDFVEKFIKRKDLYLDDISETDYLNTMKTLDFLLKEAKWTHEMKISAFASLDTKMERRYFGFTDFDPDYVDFGEGEECHCKYDAWCMFQGLDCDKGSKCDATLGGCGFVGSSSCEGYCQDEDPQLEE